MQCYFAFKQLEKSKQQISLMRLARHTAASATSWAWLASLLSLDGDGDGEGDGEDDDNLASHTQPTRAASVARARGCSAPAPLAPTRPASSL